MTEPSWILDRMRRFQDRTALIAEDRHYSFTDVMNTIQAWSDRLAGLTPRGSVFVVNGDYSISAIALLFALYVHRCIAVPLNLADAQKARKVAELTDADWILDATNGSEPEAVRPRAERHALITRICDAGEAGLIVLSSGSAGTPKAMLLSLDRLLARHRDPERYTPYLTAAFLLFDHIGGFNTMAHCTMTGGTLVKLPSRDPIQVCRTIARHKIELLPSTPTFLNMLLMSGAHTCVDLSTLKLITYGAEVMPQSTLRALNEALPHVRFKQTYGMSELGILPTKSKSSGSLWMKLDPSAIESKVVDGVLWIKSRTSMLGYLNAESPFDEVGWFCTGDVVEADGEYIRVRGRKEHVINVGGLKVFPAEVEDQILRVPLVRDVVVWGKKSPVTGFIVAASVVRSGNVDAGEARRDIMAFCRRNLEDFKVPRHIEFLDEPVYTERFKKIKAGELA
jgi:acyl-CoA synthetase (AMP-forming)/AMP-acid ligase II